MANISYHQSYQNSEDVIELYKKILHEWEYRLEPEEKEDITKAAYISIHLYMEGFDIPKIDITSNQSQAKNNITQIIKNEDHAKEDTIEWNRHEDKSENGHKRTTECIKLHESKSINVSLDNESCEDQPVIQRVKSENKQNAQATVTKIQKEEMTKLTTKQEVKHKNKPTKEMPLEKLTNTQSVPMIDTKCTAHPKIVKNYFDEQSHNAYTPITFQSNKMEFHQGNPLNSIRGSEIEWKIPWSQDTRFDQMVTAYKDDANGAFQFSREEYDTPLPNLYDVLLNAPGLSAQFVLPGQFVHPSDCYDILLLARGNFFFARFEDETFQGGIACNVPNSRVNRGN
eukprot:Gb_26831 [translate_table: standard]